MQHENYTRTDHAILHPGEIARTTSELAAPSSDFLTTSAGGRLTHDVKFNVLQAHKHDESLLESTGVKEKSFTIQNCHRCPQKELRQT
ncbi:hypothetical protein AVEN_155013-1 [Araneus ventricosus]|uniref:Uncharacterized protein n=1 Tax=Araneus ventricosus TaxID=182803 RepID=A0A4Y2A818_ARAVE|nr:hypothetical protein AVEN_155013-1 [Araneus ventricosus]